MGSRETAPRLSEDQLSVFSRQLFLMLQAGIGLEEGVSLIAGEVEDERLRSVLEGVHSRLSEGEQLSQALSETGGFPPYMVRMVEIGQASGRLDRVLDALCTYYRREAEKRRELRRAVAYPAVMALLTAVIFLALVSRVLPVFQRVFNQMGIQLSPLARTLLAVGSASQTITAVLAVALVAAAVWLLWLFRTGRGARVYSRLFARTAAGRAVDRSRLASALSMMLSSGLPLDEAMERTAHLLEDSAVGEQLNRCRAAMEGGTPLARALETAGLFSGLETGLLAAGARAGLIDQAMEELAQRCQEESGRRLEQLLSRFEYALVAVLCLAVGMVLLSVMLPLLGVLSALGG